MKLGIDLGGTKIEGVVLDHEGREIRRRRVPTQTASGYEHVIAAVAALYRELCDDIEHAPHTLGLGTPGSLSTCTGLLKNCNATVLNGKPLKVDLEAVIGRSLALQNDANCFALAEAREGAGKGYSTVFGVIIGTGCGAGIVIDGRIHEGRHGIAGEWGHHVVDPAGPPCYCGRNGCLERFVSGPAVEAEYASRTGVALDVPAIAAQAGAGNAVARDVLDGLFDHLAHGLANIVAILDPDTIILGGGLANLPGIAGALHERIAKIVFNDCFETPILVNALGDSAGVLGAAWLGAGE
jgi:fructokinase